jgi:hypothetical protein
MAMYAAVGVGALCISSSVAAVMMNKKDDETSEQPENTVEKKEIEGVGSPHHRSPSKNNSLPLIVCVAQVRFGVNVV